MWSLEQLWALGEGAGILTPCLPPGSVERGGCAYLVAPTLGVHKHQQGLHEGGRGGPDDEGSPAALLGDTARKAPSSPGGPYPHAQQDPWVPPCTTSGSELMVGLATERQLAGLTSSGPESTRTHQRLSPWQLPRNSEHQASPVPSSCLPGPRSNLRTFLAGFPLEGRSLFLLACLESVLQGKQGHW